MVGAWYKAGAANVGDVGGGYYTGSREYGHGCIHQATDGHFEGQCLKSQAARGRWVYAVEQTVSLIILNAGMTVKLIDFLVL